MTIRQTEGGQEGQRDFHQGKNGMRSSRSQPVPACLRGETGAAIFVLFCHLFLVTLGVFPIGEKLSGVLTLSYWFTWVPTFRICLSSTEDQTQVTTPSACLLLLNFKPGSYQVAQVRLELLPQPPKVLRFSFWFFGTGNRIQGVHTERLPRFFSMLVWDRVSLCR